MSSIRFALRTARTPLILRRPISSTAAQFITTKGPAAENGHPNNTQGTSTDTDLGVGEMEGAKFKIEPLHRSGEDPNTMRARLLYAHLAKMTPAQMAQYDKFLDENDWDIYYWATQEPTPTSLEAAEGAVDGKGQSEAVAPRSGEWAQTIGTFKPAYRPVPARWRNSEVLAMLRRHVISRSAGGLNEIQVGGEEVTQTGGGMAFMPPVFQTDQPQ